MENKNGQGIFYGVIGVATLVVAIIGATFAYFSATVTGNGDTVTGNTLDVTAATLSLEVEKIDYNVTGVNNDLVPADVTATEAGWGAMLSASCVNSGYTGCHVYKITADTESAIANATIAGSATSGNFVTTSGNSNSIYSGALTTSGVERYLIVYLANTNSSQNGVGTGATVETGTYTGTVTLKAEGGEVKATFTA